MHPTAPQPPPLNQLPIQVVAALSSALLYALAQPPWNQAWLGYICLIPLLLVCQSSNLRRAASLGGLFAMLVAGFVTPWLPEMLGDYFSVNTLAAWPVATLAWFGLAVPAFSAFAAFASWIASSDRSGRIRPLLIPLATAGAFMLSELLRSHGLVRGPWGLLAYSQPAHSQLAQLADLAGPYTVGGLLMCVNAGLAQALIVLLSNRRGRASILPLVPVVLLLLLGWRYGQTRLSQSFVNGNTITQIGLVQSALPRAHRFDPSRLEANLTLHLELTKKAANRGAKVVFWPELALDFQPEANPALHQQTLAATRQLEIELLAGGLGAAGTPDRPARTNSVYLIRNGRLLGRTDKVWLMPFSEARPFSSWLGASNQDAFVAGDRARLLHTTAGKVGVLTCSEAMHPSYVRSVVATGATLLANPSNDDWFGSMRSAEQPLRQAAFRAVETRRYLVRTSLGGYTAVIDPWGRQIVVAPFGEPAIAMAEVQSGNLLTLYVRFGDWLPALLGVGLVASAWRGRPKDAGRC